MRSFVERNQQLAVDNVGAMVGGSRLEVWLQMQMLRLLPHLPLKGQVLKRMERIRREVHEAANALVLKDYESAPNPKPDGCSGAVSLRTSPASTVSPCPSC